MNRAQPVEDEGTGNPDRQVDAVFVVGMHASGVELLGDAVASLGVPIRRDHEEPRSRGLSFFNERMLAARAGTGGLPAAAPMELARELSPWTGEAQSTAAAVARATGADLSGTPWIWADPRLSFLVPFWSAALGVRPAVILVHRGPATVVATADSDVGEGAPVAATWDRYNRSALVLCSRYPSLVVDYDDLANHPAGTLDAVTAFLRDLGIAVEGDMRQAVALVEKVTDRPPRSVRAASIEPDHQTLHRLLVRLTGLSPASDAVGPETLVEVTAAFYGEDYYGVSYDQAGVPYAREERVWVEFFGTVAEGIVRSLHPDTVLDAGCALGMLVEALRDRSVEARGFDLSKWAIRQIPAHLQPFCWIGSITDEIEGHYDLITCIEVLEHLPPSLADQAIGNLCRHADAVLFSSTPDDFDEPTHLNVEPGGYWSNLFMRHGFLRDFDYDASFLSPHAALYRRGQADAESLVEGYERALSAGLKRVSDHEHRAARQVEAARREFDQARDRTEGAVRQIELRRNAENLASFETIRHFEAEQRRLAGLLSLREAELTRLYDTKTMRYAHLLRWTYGRLRRRPIAPPGLGPTPPVLPDGSYQRWVELYDTIDDEIRMRIDTRVRALTERPKISVIMPVYNPSAEMLRAAIDSVRGQIYPDWELCIADDCSTDPAVSTLLEDCAASDARIKVIRRSENGHISAASNSALSLVTGEWVALLDHDDILSEHALGLVALALAEHPDAGIVYSDEDKLDEAGHRRDAFFKPDFDPLLLLGQNFVSHLGVFRKDLVDRVGGYREGYEGSQDWDLTLRVSELLEPAQVVHIPHVLYHWRVHPSSTASLVSAKPYAVDAGQRAVEDHITRTDRRARTTRIGQWGFNRVTWELPDPAPRVTIIIPTRDGRLLPRCLDSVLAFTLYPNFEVVVVDNSSRTRPALDFLRGNDHRITVIRDDRPFNHSALNNNAVAQTSGEVICLLNDDTEVIGGDWLTEMVSQLCQPGVGAVGAKLYYGDGRIQHAGVLLGVHGVAAHAHRNFDRLAVGYFGHLQLAHRMSAVTAACAVVRREAWEEINGFDEDSLPAVLNDVDLCLRLREAGWDVVWTPYAQLFHNESTSRGIDDEDPRAEALARAKNWMVTRWGADVLRNDPYYNPNLSLDAEDFSLAWPPRASY